MAGSARLGYTNTVMRNLFLIAAPFAIGSLAQG